MPRRRAVREHAVPPGTQRGEDARDHGTRAGAYRVAARPRRSQEADELTDQVVAVVRKQLRPQLRRERLEPRGAARRAGGLLLRRWARRPRSTARVELALDGFRNQRCERVRAWLVANPESRHRLKSRRVSRAKLLLLQVRFAFVGLFHPQREAENRLERSAGRLRSAAKLRVAGSMYLACSALGEQQPRASRALSPSVCRHWHRTSHRSLCSKGVFARRMGVRNVRRLCTQRVIV